MAKLKEIKLKQLSQALKEGKTIPIEKVGQRLKDIREVLGMTQKQLAKKLGIKQPLLSRIEDNALSCTLNTLAKVAQALGCDFMGAVASREPLEKQIMKQAKAKAKNITERTFATMAMERQSPGGNAYDYQLNKLTAELAANPSPELWEE